jgi:hypothetical protein
MPTSDAIVFDPSWPEAAKPLMLRAIERHGGWSLWTRLESVTICLRTFGGLLPRLKGHGRSFHLPRSLTTFPKLEKTIWNEQPGQRSVGVFDRGDVRLLEPTSGQVVRESLQHRRTFGGLRKLRRWNALDAFYFFGYAFSSYTAAPFVLPSLRFVKTIAGRWRGAPLTGVRVAYSADAQVHSRTQGFLFDDAGLLRRNDYVADVVGALAMGAHGWDDYVTIEGLPIPTRRTVVPRLGTAALGSPTILSATFDDLAVHLV